MKKKKDEYIEDLVRSVQEDFLIRQRERKPFEARWRLNNNFLLGNQFVGINSLSDIELTNKTYFWQERKVFNHIAPIIETRLAKLNTLKPEMNVIPTSSSEEDEKIARLSQDILYSCYEKLNLSEIISRATTWSEITGTSFYKVIWNGTKGKKIYNKDGKIVYEGEIEIDAVSPF